MTQLMDDLRAPAGTWGQELQAYEREKRRVVDGGLLAGQQLRLTKGQVKAQERVFDPLLQRFRDPGLEGSQRLLEERARISHLNHAQDLDIVRSQPFNILNQSSKIEALAPGQDPTRLERSRNMGKSTSQPPTAVDYNIVSNMPFEKHHWQRPSERPQAQEREPKPRIVAPWSVKDFDILTNRYVSDHDAKLATEQQINILEATHKHGKQNKLDPVSQQYNDPRLEERARVAMDAAETEMALRAQALKPPAVRDRLSAHYDVVGHAPIHHEALAARDFIEEVKQERFKNRYIVEHNWHVQDVKNDHITGARKMNRVAPERYEEQKKRGFDIIDNRGYGRGLQDKLLHEDYSQKRPTPWEKAQQGRPPAAADQGHAATLRLTSSASAPQLRRGNDGGGQHSPPRTGSVAASTSTRRQAHSQSSSRLASGSATPWGGRSAHSGASSGCFNPVRAGATGFAPPPAPSIPGSATGSVFSRPRG